MNSKNIIKWILILSGSIFFIWIYKTYNPLETGLFPSCPFKKYTGFLCAGCGSQRAIHFLLNGDFLASFKANPLLLLFSPYMLFGAFIKSLLKDKPSYLIWRKRLYGPTAIKIVFVIIMSFWILRNL